MQEAVGIAWIAPKRQAGQKQIAHPATGHLDGRIERSARDHLPRFRDPVGHRLRDRIGQPGKRLGDAARIVRGKVENFPIRVRQSQKLHALRKRPRRVKCLFDTSQRFQAAGERDGEIESSLETQAGIDCLAFHFRQEAGFKYANRQDSEQQERYQRQQDQGQHEEGRETGLHVSQPSLT